MRGKMHTSSLARHTALKRGEGQKVSSRLNEYEKNLFNSKRILVMKDDCKLFDPSTTQK
jgi:hypothetical protein